MTASPDMEDRIASISAPVSDWLALSSTRLALLRSVVVAEAQSAASDLQGRQTRPWHHHPGSVLST